MGAMPLPVKAVARRLQLPTFFSPIVAPNSIKATAGRCRGERHRVIVRAMPTRRPAETTPDQFSAPPKTMGAEPSAVSKGKAEPDAALVSQPRHFLPKDLPGALRRL